MLIALLKGFIVGMGASIPLGPLGVLCVQKTLSKGRNSGLITGMGASISDTIYAAISLLGLAFIYDFIQLHKNWVLAIGGIIIVLIGLKIYLTNPIKQIRQKSKKSKHVEDFIEAFIMTITNPGAIFLILGLLATVGINIKSGTTDVNIVPILWGVFLGSVTWWYILSTSINVFRNKFRLKQLIMINKISGIIIVALGFISFFDGLIKLILKF
jgi:Putative threonine efflux protein